MLYHMFMRSLGHQQLKLRWYLRLLHAQHRGISINVWVWYTATSYHVLSICFVYRLRTTKPVTQLGNHVFSSESNPTGLEQQGICGEYHIQY